MKAHSNHNILGNYCWTCQRPTVVGIPGWSKPSRDDGPHNINEVVTSVVWADGSEDAERVCDDCHSSICKYPIHKDQYSEIGIVHE